MASLNLPFPKILIIVFILSFFSPFGPQISISEDSVAMPSFAFGWLNDNDTFVAGDIATIKVIVLGNFEAQKFNHTFNPNITVNNKMGNSSLISGVSSNFDGDFSNWRITFVPITVGLLNVLITDDNYKVFDSSLHFHVTPGSWTLFYPPNLGRSSGDQTAEIWKLYPSAGVVSWMGQVNEFVAGAVVTILILPKDAFGNNVTASSEGTEVPSFRFSASFRNGSVASLLNVTNKGWNELGYLQFEFIAVTAGSHFLYVNEGNQTLIGSPLIFKVIPGLLDVPSCVPQWKAATKFFQLFSHMEIHIHQRDRYGNLVSGLYPFDVEVIETGTNLSMPVADLRFAEVVPGIQLCSFSLAEPGNFTLVIADKEQSNLVSQVPYDFSVYIGYCSGIDSLINGSGLNDSVAGEVSRLTVFLKDAYQYPSPVELERLQVQILRENDTDYLWSRISPIDFVNGSSVPGETSLGTFPETAYAPSIYTNNNSAENWKVRASEFEIIYKPEKSGIYNINLFCGNIQLNSGHPIKKEVHAGEVNMSISGVVNFAPRVPKLIKNEILIKLMDSFSNPVVSERSKLKIEVGSINRSETPSLEFVDNNDGSYIGFYRPKDTGNYEICVSYNGNHFLPCPFGVKVYSLEYFPKAENDLVSVWEDESIAFSTLENDYFAGDNASIVQFTEPGHGSILQYGHLLRYTPYKGFNGNDSFMYTISDVEDNHASAYVIISVLSIPPQFVSVPGLLQATEDMISPTFGGFPGLEIIYSDSTENISVRLSARFGTVFLSPMVMQFWQPMWTELSVSKGDEKADEIILEGCLEVINYALQFLQYLGDENFYGEDAIRVSTMNKNGMNHIEVPVFVEPINDPPFIKVPEFINLEEKRSEEELLIFDKERDKFNYSVGDPDLLVSGNSSQFLLMFSVEVNDGFISTNLPAELISTTELKLKSSYQWQPLQTFVTISKHFMVKAKGIRFRGTVHECNSVMQQLSYHGSEHDAVLTVTINDMGEYGCFLESSEAMSRPLFAKATISLRRGRPMSSFVAHTLGSAIVFEFIALFSLGMVLMLFTCKCALVLIRERKGRHNDQVQNIELSNVQHPSNQTSCADLSDFTGCCSSPFSISQTLAKFRQRAGAKIPNKNHCKESVNLSQSSSDHQETPAGFLSTATCDGRNKK